MVKLLRCWRLGVRVASFPVLCGVLLALLPRPVAAAEKLATDSASQSSAVQALGMLQQAPDSDMRLMGLPLSFDAKRPPFRRGPPELGEHTGTIFPARQKG